MSLWTRRHMCLMAGNALPLLLHAQSAANNAGEFSWASALALAFDWMEKAAVLAPWALRQERPQTPSETAELFRKMSEEYESEGLAPFKGITTNGDVLPGLFEIKPTGVPTEPVRNAAERFIATLSPVQLARTMYPVDDIEWRKWMNQHFYARQGVSFAEMTAAQRDAAFGLMSASLSARGFELTRNIMRLNETLAELSNDHDFLGEWLYFIQIYGKPSATEPWGWKLEGHHAIVNYFVLGDQVVMTPLFVGSEPARATSGKYGGLEVLQQEQNDGLKLLNAFSPEQRKQAILNFAKTGNNNLSEAFKDNVVIDYAGLRTNELAAPVRQSLRDLIHLYVSNMDEGHTRVKMDEVDRHLDNTVHMDRRHAIGQRVLLPRAEPGHPYRIRSPASRKSGEICARPQEADPAAHSLRSANSQWQ